MNQNLVRKNLVKKNLVRKNLVMAFSLKCKIVSSEISVHGGLQQESRGHQQMQPGGRQELQGGTIAI